MQWSAFASLVTLTGIGLLAAAALHDMAFRTVPHTLCAGVLLCGVLLRLLDHGLLAGSIACVAIGAFSVAIWWFGWLGGGDVKLLTAAALFVRPDTALDLVLYTSLAGGVLALFYLLGGRIAPRPAPQRPQRLLGRAWRCELWRLHRRGPLPYAAAIAAGGIFATLVA